MTVYDLPIKTVTGLNAPNDEALRKAVSYDPNSGVFLRREKTGPNVKVGSIAGSVDKQGYRRIRVSGTTYQAHRLAWQYVHGAAPCGSIDHINGQRDDNRIENLRLVDHSTNLENLKGARADNVLGVLGVRKMGKKFDARITVKGKTKSLGTFETVEEAASVYLESKRKLHKGCTI